MHAAAFLVGAAGLLSRILGLVRDRLLASQFGASQPLDVYYASFQIPDFLFTVFLLGAAAPAILPVFVEYWEASEERAREFVRGLVFLFSITAAALAIGIVITAPYLVRLVAPGFDRESQDLMVDLTRIMMVSPVFLGISNIFSSVVQARRRFFLFSLTALVYNLGIIAGILFFLPVWGIKGLAGGVILGAFLHMAVQLPGVKEVLFPFRFSLPPRASIIRVLQLSIPRVIALSLNQAVIMLLIAIGSLLSAGTIAVFQFANNLRYLPVGVFGVSYAIAAFPKLTEAGLRRDAPAFYGDLYAMIESILFWTVPVALLMVILRAHIVRLILGVGNFSWVDTRLTAAALAILAIAVIFESLLPLLLRAFYALGNTKLPLAITALSALSTAALAPLFVSLFTANRVSGRFVASLLKVGDIANLGVLGLALAFSLGTIIQVVGLWISFSVEARRHFGTSFRNGIALAVTRILAASIFSAALGYGVLFLLSFSISLSTFAGVLAQTILTFAASALFYALSMYAMGSEEIRSMTAAFRGRLWKRSALLPQNLDHGAKPPL